MTPSDRQWIDHVLRSEWIAPESPGPLRPRMVSPDEIDVGRWRISTRETTAARPNDPFDESLNVCFLHDDWKVIPLKVYRPLVYYAAFGQPDIFACLRIAVQSLLDFGQWMHDIAVLTRSEDLGAVHQTLSPMGLGDRLHVVTVPGVDMLDWCLARYRIDAARLFRTHQPILYLDTDVVCDGPLDPFCLALARSSMVEAKAEGALGEGHPESDGHWFGWRLMVADGMAFDPSERGFSSGILGFANVGVAGTAFDAILRCAYGHAERTGDRRHYAGFDQPIANYVLRKLSLFSPAQLDATASFYRVQSGPTPLPGPHRPRGLVHFNGAVGDAPSKRGAMERYLSFLLSQRATHG